jgi:hypothetical protein
MPVKISEGTFKDRKCITVENSRLKMICVTIGSRMVSLVDKASGREFMLQSNKENYLVGEYDSCYGKYDPVGFDEMFPTIDECYYSTFPWKGTRIPDHGELWGLEWGHALYDSYVELNVFGIRFPYKFMKKISFKEENVLRIDYCVTNLSKFDMEFIWSAHPIIKIDCDSQIILPIDCEKGVTVYNLKGEIGIFGNEFNMLKTLNGYKDKEIAIKLSNEARNSVYKFFIKDKLKSGYCGIHYPSDNNTITMRFPVQSVPYLGILIDEGSINHTYSAILEPCTAAYDKIDFAKAYSCNSILKANDCYEWYLEFETI